MLQWVNTTTNQHAIPSGIPLGTYREDDQLRSASYDPERDRVLIADPASNTSTTVSRHTWVATSAEPIDRVARQRRELLRAGDLLDQPACGATDGACRLAPCELERSEQVAELERQQSDVDDGDRPIADGTSVKVLGEIDATDATGVLGRATGSGQTYGVRSEVSSTSGYGLSTPDDATVGGTAELAALGGGVTGGSTVTSLTSDRLSVTNGALTADVTGVSNNGATVYANADEINFGPGVYVRTDGNGAVTVSTFPFSAVAFLDPADDTPRRLNINGTVEDYATSKFVETIGPPTTDLTGDGTPDLPIKDANENLVLVDIDGTTQTLDSSGTLDNASMGVGDWNDDGTVEVVYRRTDKLYTVTPGRSPTELGFDLRRGAAVADFDGDGAIEIASATTGGDIELVEADGTTTTLSPSYSVAQSAKGALDYTDTGVPDVIHLNEDTGSTDERHVYYYDVVNDTTGPVTDASGSTLSTPSLPGIR